MAQTKEKSNCYCGNEKSYDACCKPLHEGKLKPPTPESLMRSRFSAYKLSLIDYLEATHHPKYHWQDERKGIEESCKNNTWDSLKVFKSEVDKKQKHLGKVAFAAYYSSNSASHVLCEFSNFILENEQWYYTDGIHAENESELAKLCGINRNDPCWCGSGKKYKKCHLT